MTFRTVLKIETYSRPFTLTVEPWATDHQIGVGQRCEVVAINPDVVPTFGAAIAGEGKLVIWVDEGGSTYEFWCDGIREFNTSNAIPW